jgi:hypothetical protein
MPTLQSYFVYQSGGSAPMMKSLSAQMKTTMMNWTDVLSVTQVRIGSLKQRTWMAQQNLPETGKYFSYILPSPLKVD